MTRRTDKEKERQAIELYNDHEQELSLESVGERLGISNATVWRILVRNNRPRRSIMKYPKTDFSGNLAEQARISGLTEDFSTRFNRKQIEVRTSTTHPAQIALSQCSFGRYGHVGTFPTYNRRYNLYQWEVYVLLNRSFDFIIKYKEDRVKFLAEIARRGYNHEYLAGLSDAESWVGIDLHNGHPRAILEIGITNRELLDWARRILGGRVFGCSGVHKLRLHGEQAVEAIRRLPMMHEEKATSKELILRHYDNGGIGLQALWEYRALRRKIDEEVRLCKLQARLEWIRRQGKPHQYDPDQTIPKN